MAKATTKKPAVGAGVVRDTPATQGPAEAATATAQVLPAAAPAAQVPPAAAPAVAALAKKQKAKMRDALFVKSVPTSIRRAGFRFDRDGVGIDLTLLTEEQLEILENDPDLVAERCQYPVDEDA